MSCIIRSHNVHFLLQLNPCECMKSNREQICIQNTCTSLWYISDSVTVERIALSHVKVTDTFEAGKNPSF